MPGECSAGPAVPPGPDVAELIAAQARSRPDAVAVTCEGARLSYRRLTGRASQLARYLREAGVGPEVPVGVCLERAADQLVALLGVLESGGAYVPLDPGAPAERTRYVIADTGMPLLLTQHRLEPALAGAGTQTVSLDRAGGRIGRHSKDDLADGPAPDQLGYVIYTSGSTGRPKGVTVERAVISAHTRAMIAEYGLRPEDRVLQFSQFSFDASLEQILPTLAAGARLVMRGPEIWSPRQLLEELVGQQVTVMNLPPAYWQQAVREWARAPQDLAGTRLRLAIIGGDRLEPRAVAQWRDLGLPRVRLLNAYGPTETTITATLADAGNERDVITIGRPLAGRTVYILDGDGAPVPAGVLGELHIGGPLLARGYLNQPELTAERFVRDPFGPPGGRLYRTGDRARFLPDGRIEYAGRQDQQVKIRGYRIELGEVEAALGQHPAVGEAVVVTQGDGAATELVAFVVTSTAEPLPEADLRRHLRERLPGYMQPAVIEQLERMPRLASGKPDRRGLPEIRRASRLSADGHVPPRSPTEQQLAAIWEELLDVRPVGIRDNFFDLGGNSLLAAQLVGRIEQAHGTRLPLAALLDRPTIEQLAALLARPAAAQPAGAVKGEGEAGMGRRVGGGGAEQTAGTRVLPVQAAGTRVLPVQAAGTRVLPVQAEGSQPPFFFLHGFWTGEAFYCFTLARACGPDQPFYVIEPCTFRARDGAPPLGAIARAHIDAMREVQPRGPYRLGGYCNGGLLAYEMARQLERDGERVAFLGLVSPSAPAQSSLLRTACERAARLMRGRRGSAGRSTADLECAAAADLEGAATADLEGAAAGAPYLRRGTAADRYLRRGTAVGRYLRRGTAADRYLRRGTAADLYLRVRHAQRHIYRRLLPRGSRVQDFGKLLAIEPRLAAMFPPRDALYADYVGVFNWAATGYRAGIYGGKITFFWPRDERGAARSWQPVTRQKERSDVVEHLVDGAAMTSVTEHVQGLAEALSRSLGTAREPQEASSRG
jgi:amino acid adenylation domain-containing protein